MRDIAEIKVKILNLVGNFPNIKETQINPLNTNFLASPKSMTWRYNDTSECLSHPQLRIDKFASSKDKAS